MPNKQQTSNFLIMSERQLQDEAFSAAFAQGQCIWCGVEGSSPYYGAACPVCTQRRRRADHADSPLLWVFKDRQAQAGGNIIRAELLNYIKPARGKHHA